MASDTVSKGIRQARDLIAYLNELNETDQGRFVQQHIRREQETARQSLLHFRSLNDVFNIPMNREDFDKIYSGFRKYGDSNPEQTLKEEADFYHELATNKDKIGLEFISLTKSRRLADPQLIKMIDDIAKIQNVPPEQVDEILSRPLNLDMLPEAGLSADEYRYIEARRMIVKNMMQEHYYSRPHHAPAESGWGQRMQAEAEKERSTQIQK